MRVPRRLRELARATRAVDPETKEVMRQRWAGPPERDNRDRRLYVRHDRGEVHPTRWAWIP